MTYDKEKAFRVYRKLFGFYKDKISIHFKLNSGGDAVMWRNGDILSLDDKTLTMVLKEFVLGERPYLLEEVDEDSINAYIKKGEDEK
jgi:hypothetical protein